MTVTVETRTTRRVMTYTLHYEGVWGRNRKSKRELCEIGSVPVETPLDEATVRARMVEALRALKAKGTLKVQVIEQSESIETIEYPDGPTMQIRSFALMAGRRILREEWTP